jgi:hypothetical protein
MRIDTNLGMRAALVQGAGVLVLGLLTGLTLSHSFFVDWGWIVGPAAWMLAATVTSRALHLPLWPTLLGAALAGLPSAAATIVGLHWVGAVLAIVLFAVWCGGMGARGLTARAA